MKDTNESKDIKREIQFVKNKIAKTKNILIICAVLQAVFAIFGIAVGAIVTLMVANGSERLARIEYERAISEAWAEVDTAILADEKNLAMLDAIQSRSRQPVTGIELARKRQIGFLTLNVLATTFAGIKSKVVDEKMRRKLNIQLEPFVVDDDIYTLSQDGVYQVGFAEYCQELRSSLLPQQKSDSATATFPTSADGKKSK